MAIVSHIQECNYWLRLKHVRWYILVPCGHMCTVSGPCVQFLACKFLACKFLAGCSSFICHEELEWLDLEDRWMRVSCLWGFAELEQLLCEVKQWTLDTFTPQLHTLQTMKSWSGPGNEARVLASGAIRACSARAATCGVEQWTWSTHFTLTHYHFKVPVRPHLHMQCARGMMQTCIPAME